MTSQIESTSSENTENFGAKLAQNLKGGEVIELIADLGGGKTTFVRGLARGLGSKDTVGSPTFTISREYSAGNLQIHHFDFYRLEEPGIVAAELNEVIHEPRNIVVVEWGDIVHDVLPPKRIRINFSLAAHDESTRLIEISVPEELNYVLKDIA